MLTLILYFTFISTHAFVSSFTTGMNFRSSYTAGFRILLNFIFFSQLICWSIFRDFLHNRKSCLSNRRFKINLLMLYSIHFTFKTGILNIFGVVIICGSVEVYGVFLSQSYMNEMIIKGMHYFGICLPKYLKLYSNICMCLLIYYIE